MKYIKTKPFFGKKLKKMQGNKNERDTPYLIDIENNNNKLYKDEEKHSLYNRTWKNVFSISEEENQNFGEENETRVNNFLDENLYRTKPYEFANTRRSDPNNFLTKPIENKHIISIIKQFKKKAPGKSGINKEILDNLPKEALDRFNVILNLALSMGYFMLFFKNGIMIFTTKPGKNNKYQINYRPITLLEVPGKIFEKIINNRFSRYLEENNILHPDQYGFRKNRGTETAF